MLPQGLEIYQKALDYVDPGNDLCQCKDISGSKKEGRLHGSGADTARVLIRRIKKI